MTSWTWLCGPTTDRQILLQYDIWLLHCMIVLVLCYKFIKIFQKIIPKRTNRVCSLNLNMIPKCKLPNLGSDEWNWPERSVTNINLIVCANVGLLLISRNRVYLADKSIGSFTITNLNLKICHVYSLSFHIIFKSKL